MVLSRDVSGKPLRELGADNQDEADSRSNTILSEASNLDELPSSDRGFLIETARRRANGAHNDALQKFIRRALQPLDTDQAVDEKGPTSASSNVGGPVSSIVVHDIRNDTW